MKKLTLAILICFVLVLPSQALESDVFTSASLRNFYPPAASFEELAALTFNGVVVISTTNPDGSPNAAVIIPSIFKEQYVIMRMAPNQTLENLERDGRMVITAFVPKIGGESEEPLSYAAVRRYGARIYCIVMEQDREYEEVVKEWNEQVEDERYVLPLGTPIFRIVRVAPVG